MSNWEKNVRKVVPYVPGEQPHEADMIKLNTNENPYPPSPVLPQSDPDRDGGYPLLLRSEERRSYLVKTRSGFQADSDF